MKHAFLAALAVVLAACSSRHETTAPLVVAEPVAPLARPDAGAGGAKSAAAVAPAEPPAPAVVEALPIAGDREASLVKPLDGKAPRIVFMPGICSNAHWYVDTFREAARAHGGVVAIEGDQPCGNLKAYHSFSWDASKAHARLQAALAAAGRDETSEEPLTIVGYSQGASLAEQLVQRFPKLYTRVVLMGAPTDPLAAHFKTTQGVVTMSCSRDIPWRMKESARKMRAAKIPATYIEMPSCTHGNITDGERVFTEAFDFLASAGS